jgi:hypothetical protein
MKTQHQYSTAHQGIQGMASIVGAVVVIGVTSLIVLISQPAPAALPAKPVTIVTPAVAPGRPLTTNRFFQDEISAASALDLGGLQSPLATWPERLSDVRPATTAARMPARPATTNRIFLDEISAAAVRERDTVAAGSSAWPERLGDVRPVVAAAPALIPNRPVTTNRFFQDEINAATALDLGDPVSRFAAWPERISDQQTATAIAAAVPVGQPRPVITNRIFLDEIAGADAAGSGDVAPTPAETTNQRGPR